MKINIFSFLLINLINYIYSSIEGILFHKNEKLTTRNNYVVFASKDFEIGENMLFSLLVPDHDELYNYVSYYYLDGWENVKNFLDNDEINKSGVYNTKLIFYEDSNNYNLYFKINKNKDELEETNGRYLVIKFNFYFENYNPIKIITNIEGDNRNGDTPGIVIASITLFFFLLLLVYIFRDNKYVELKGF